MRFTHNIAIITSGIIWLIVGLFLLYKGLFFTVLAKVTYNPADFPLYALFGKIKNDPESIALISVLLSLVVGLIKGRVALAKSAKRTVTRLLSTPAPLKAKDVFPLPYILLVMLMMLLGMSLKYFKVPYDIRGFVDVAVGSALINGAIIYFKLVSMLKRERVKKK